MAVLRRTRPAPTVRWAIGDECCHPRAGNGVIDAIAYFRDVAHAFIRHDGYHRNTCLVSELSVPISLTAPSRVIRRRR